VTLPDYGWLRARLETPEGRARIAKASELAAVARELGGSSAQLAIAWCLLNPNVSTVILGASSAEQLRENLRSLELVPRLTGGVVERIESILQNRPELPQQF
jgi:aryl-alcohol dehydrogenase-like predicted oxidoreductase